MAASGPADPIVILGAARTPIGALGGALAPMTAAQLAGAAMAACLQRAGLGPSDIDETIIGCVLTAGQGQAPARQAAFSAGLPQTVPATTINKMCGSGMKAVMIGHDQLLAGQGRAILAGGMESMTRAPYLLPKMRGGARLGHDAVLDHMFLDGLEDAYEAGRLMGSFAEECADRYGFSREDQDRYASVSLQRAIKACAQGLFDAEIVPVTTGRDEAPVREDELPARAKPERIPLLKPAFREGGTITAANASSISDGAAALVLMRESQARERGLSFKARILGHASHAQEPRWFTTAPVPAARKLVQRLGWRIEDVDLWEINEAFAVVPMAAMRELAIDHDRLNVHGGACALGHPIGASGARIIVTLINALEQRGLRTGVAAICIGGGEATALALERVPQPT